jgi:hypothetical protein
MASDPKNTRDTPPRDTTRGKPRRAYSRPTLTEYGPVSKLTQGTRTRQADSPAAGFRMTNCL